MENINYRGTIADQPVDVIVSAPDEDQKLSENPPQVRQVSVLDRILDALNSRPVVPVGELPLYDKGNH